MPKKRRKSSVTQRPKHRRQRWTGDSTTVATCSDPLNTAFLDSGTGSVDEHEMEIDSTPTENVQTGNPIHVEHSYFNSNSRVLENDDVLDPLNTAFLIDPDTDETYVGNFDVLSEYETLRSKLLESDLHSYVLHKGKSEVIQILNLYERNGKSCIKSKIVINLDFSVKIVVHNKELPSTHTLWESVSTTCKNPEQVLRLVEKVSQYNVCIGSPEGGFTSLVPIGSALSDNKEPTILAYHEGNFNASQGEIEYDSTIRSVQCDMLVAKGTRCGHCAKYRKCLWKRKERLDNLQSSDVDFTKSTFKHCDMPPRILIKKIQQQKQKIKTLEHEVEKLSRDLRNEIRKRGVSVTAHEDMELKDLMGSCQADVDKSYPDPNSFQRLFWSQQLKYEQNGKYGMRWHPMIIRWCLYIRQKSSAAYDALRESGFVKLPSNRTLFDYSHYVNSALGFQSDVLKMVGTEAEKLGMLQHDWKSYVGVLFDEIRVKEDLVYDKHSGELIGFCDLDSVGNSIMELQSLVTKSESRVAKYVLVLMVRGLATTLKFPLAGFATTGITADFIYPIFWQAVSYLEVVLKLKVLFVTCDGASSNRRFFRLHKVAGQDFIHSTVNPHDKDRNIYFVSDVPHLLKTTRNCFSNSGSHRNTRHMWFNGKDISWLHLLRLFEEHCEFKIYNPCPKLTRSHIDLTAFSYMKVNLAAQVLSDTVANALEMLYGDFTSETVNFIRKFNTFFDILNVRSIFEGKNNRNPNLYPFTSPDDERLRWLVDDFLGYLSAWEYETEHREGNFTKTHRSSMMLSKQTITGLRITVCSITECVKFMLNKGASFILTHMFNQDPLEQHFGHYRWKSGANRNPSVFEIRNTMTTLRTVGAQALIPKRGNTRGNNDARIIDNTPLPRRR